MTGALASRIAAICRQFNRPPIDDRWRIIGDVASDVLCDLTAHATLIPPLWRSRLLAAGISRQAMYGLGRHGQTVIGGLAVPSPIFAGQVAFLDESRFEWAPHRTDDAKPVSALLGLCHDVDGRAIDIWATSVRSGQVGVLRGAAGVVDEGELWRPRIAEELVVHPDVLSWLRAGRTGAFTVNWSRAVCLLRYCAPLLAEDVGRGRLIERHFAKCGLIPPTISVRRSSIGVAA